MRHAIKCLSPNNHKTSTTNHFRLHLPSSLSSIEARLCRVDRHPTLHGGPCAMASSRVQLRLDRERWLARLGPVVPTRNPHRELSSSSHQSRQRTSARDSRGVHSRSRTKQRHRRPSPRTPHLRRTPVPPSRTGATPRRRSPAPAPRPWLGTGCACSRRFACRRPWYARLPS